MADINETIERLEAKVGPNQYLCFSNVQCDSNDAVVTYDDLLALCTAYREQAKELAAKDAEIASQLTELQKLRYQAVAGNLDALAAADALRDWVEAHGICLFKTHPQAKKLAAAYNATRKETENV